MMNFDEITWHDTEITSIFLDRSAPGLKDVLEIRCTNKINGSFTVVFSNVWKITSDMNFGVVATETIRFVNISESDDRIDIIKNQWKNVGIDIQRLSSADIETNSTASKLFVAFENLEIHYMI